ncbi:ArsR/SmtB family transcription factor [Pseudomonas saliphila]|uniref:ArsR/SmtB family transcription factor n=1 Tax=Pseudomonas saliphila TaxID=2586906 RepID=UPI0038B4AA57
MLPTGTAMPEPAPNLDLDKLRAAADQAQRLLKTLANPDRLLLLCRLIEDELSVGELEAALGILQPTLSQQLGVLRREGLVDTRREGKQIYYRIASPQALAVIDTLYRLYCSTEVE